MKNKLSNNNKIMIMKLIYINKKKTIKNNYKIKKIYNTNNMFNKLINK